MPQRGKFWAPVPSPVFLHGKFAVSVRDTGWDITAMATVLSQKSGLFVGLSAG